MKLSIGLAMVLAVAAAPLILLSASAQPSFQEISGQYTNEQAEG